jgi:shikimate dehydrogenase
LAVKLHAQQLTDTQMITGKTKLLAIIGNPLEHSLSPVMQNSALARMGLDYVYVPLPIKPENLNAAIASLTAIDNLVGFNATIPHKQAIIPFLSEVSPIAQAVGAVNTVWRTNTGWSGTNTDVEGFVSPLKHLGQNNRTTAVILGYGGAARAVVAGCHQLGFESMIVVGRSQEKLHNFGDSWRNSSLSVNLGLYPWQNLSDLISKADLVVNTTPVGMYPHIEESPVSVEEMTQLRRGAIVYDLIYNPSPTVFLHQAQKQGAIAIDGLEMLVQQGAAALKIWLQQEHVPVDVMRQSLQQHLGLTS